MIDVVGDGNCLFRCISFKLSGSEDNHDHYRQLCADTMQEHKELYYPQIHRDLLKEWKEDASVFDQYIAQLRRPNNNAGLLEMKALSQALGLEFQVEGVGENTLTIKYGKDGSQSRQVVRLLRVKDKKKYKDGHFVLLTRKIRKRKQK